MNLPFCPHCNSLNPDERGKLQKSTSVGLLRSTAKEGCRPCQIILEGIKGFTIPSNDFEVKLNWSNDSQETLTVLIWTGLKMTRNPKRSIMVEHVAPLRLEFFAKPGRLSHWPAFAVRPEIAIDSASEPCFGRIQVWIKNCIEGHADCKQTSRTVLPTRVIDVGAVNEPQRLSLVEMGGSEGDYFALSHCWGKSQPLKTTKATLQERITGISWESLPKTFQDAIAITRRLGVQYIWIDSLCIIQDDDYDWATEAANMGTIYEQSLLTISASIAPSSTHGIFAHRKPALKIESVDENDSASTIFVRKIVSHNELSTEASKGGNSNIPLLTRAWAYQERLLATRVLHYLPHELFWECRSAIRCECGVYMPGAKLRQHSKRAFSKVIQRNKQDPSKKGIEPWRWTVVELKMWPQIVAEYSARDLTFRKDRLPALSGVAKRLHESNPSIDYLAGIWSDHLPAALVWRVLRKPSNSNHDTSPVQGPLGSRCYQPNAQTPSWSWISLEGDSMSIIYPEKQFSDARVEIINAQTVPSGIDPFSTVNQGTIKLRGLVVSAVLSYSKGETQKSSSIKYFLTRGHLSRSFIPDTPLSSEDDFDFQKSGSTVYCLLVGSFGHGDIHALVLRRSRFFDYMYTRLGLLVFRDQVQVNSLGNAWFDEAMKLEIVLI